MNQPGLTVGECPKIPNATFVTRLDFSICCFEVWASMGIPGYQAEQLCSIYVLG